MGPTKGLCIDADEYNEFRGLLFLDSCGRTDQGSRLVGTRFLFDHQVVQLLDSEFKVVKAVSESQKQRLMALGLLLIFH